MFSETTLNSLYRYGLSLTNNEADAYDLLHTALERFLQPATQHKSIDRPEFYLRRMMRNQFIDQLRREQRFPLESLDRVNDSTIDVDLTSLEQMSIAQQSLEKIWQELNPLERELLHLWAVEEFTAREIAEQLDSPRGTILSRIHRLRKKLERFADKEYLINSGDPTA